MRTVEPPGSLVHGRGGQGERPSRRGDDSVCQDLQCVQVSGNISKGINKLSYKNQYLFYYM